MNTLYHPSNLPRNETFYTLWLTMMPFLICRLAFSLLENIRANNHLHRCEPWGWIRHPINIRSFLLRVAVNKRDKQYVLTRLKSGTKGFAFSPVKFQLSSSSVNKAEPNKQAKWTWHTTMQEEQASFLWRNKHKFPCGFVVSWLNRRGYETSVVKNTTLHMPVKALSSSTWAPQRRQMSLSFH